MPAVACDRATILKGEGCSHKFPAPLYSSGRKRQRSALTAVRESNHEEMYAIQKMLAPGLPAADTRAISLQP
jgi:hypothetical protein